MDIINGPSRLSKNESFESILVVFNERATMIQFLVILPTVCRVYWIGCESEYTELSWIGLDWVIKLLDWVGLDLEKWTLCPTLPQTSCTPTLSRKAGKIPDWRLPD